MQQGIVRNDFLVKILVKTLLWKLNSLIQSSFVENYFPQETDLFSQISHSISWKADKGRERSEVLFVTWRTDYYQLFSNWRLSTQSDWLLSNPRPSRCEPWVMGVRLTIIYMLLNRILTCIYISQQQRSVTFIHLFLPPLSHFHQITQPLPLSNVSHPTRHKSKSNQVYS